MKLLVIETEYLKCIICQEYDLSFLLLEIDEM